MKFYRELRNIVPLHSLFISHLTSHLWRMKGNRTVLWFVYYRYCLYVRFISNLLIDFQLKFIMKFYLNKNYLILEVQYFIDTLYLYLLQNC